MIASALIGKLRSGDPEALGTVYDEHHEHVRAFARRLLGDDAAAEDLVQEIFLALPRAIRRYREDAPLKSFLVGVMANHARHHLRTAIRRRAAHERSRTDATPQPTPEDDFRRRELREVLVRALDAISFEQRLAFVLSEIEDYSAAEVGKMIGVPEATVRTRVFHAKKKLRELLEKRGAHERT